jgi:uncharacterized protein YdeI (YjbR/CyaY-like superfamily)
LVYKRNERGPFLMKIPEHPLRFQDKDEWRAWLQENHAAQDEAWLVILKKHAARPGISLEQATEEAVCFGWIDSAMKGTGEDYYYLRFTPRNPGSVWSLSNQKKVERAIAEGRMTDAGMAKVQEAKENGQWEAAIRREELASLPEDLIAALAGNETAQANFEKYPASQVKMFLYWIGSAKTEKTRQKRIQATVEMAARNKRLGEG